MAIETIKKITELPEQTDTPAADDYLITVDSSEVAPANQTKKQRADKVRIFQATQIVDGIITGPKIQAAAISATQLNSFSVTETKIADLAISTNKLQNGCVTAAKLDSSINLQGDFIRTYRDSDQIISPNTDTSLVWALSYASPSAMWNASTPEKLWSVRDGYYIAVLNVTLRAASVNTYTWAQIKKSDNNIVAFYTTMNNPMIAPSFSLSAVFRLPAASYVEAHVMHNNGSSLHVEANGNWSMHFLHDA